MLGKYQLQFTPEMMASGMASGNYASDGALDPNATERCNIFMQPGAFYSNGVGTDKGASSSAGAMIASSEDSQLVVPNNRILINSSGYIYSYDGSTLTQRIATAVRSYSFGVTDIAPFAGEHYATSTTHLAKFNTSTWTYTSESHQAFSNTSDPHPLLVYEDLLFIGDGNLLRTYNPTGPVYSIQLTLANSERIIALSIDPGSGMMMISCAVSYNPTDTVQQKGIVYLHDGISAKPRKRIITDGVIHGFNHVGGQVYCGMGQVLGVWNGAGVTYLRRLANVTQTTNELPYKHHFANTGNILHVVDGHKVLSYGETFVGRKAFSYTFTTGQSSEKITGCIANIGQNNVGVAWKPSSTMYFYSYPMYTAGTAGTIRFTDIYTPRPVFPRMIRIITTGIPDTGAGSAGSVFLYDENGNNIAGTSSITNTTGATKYMFDFNINGSKVQNMQLNVLIADQAWGLVQAFVYYDIAE